MRLSLMLFLNGVHADDHASTVVTTAGPLGETEHDHSNHADDQGDVDMAAMQKVMESCPKFQAVMLKYADASRPKVADLAEPCAELETGDCKSAFDALKTDESINDVKETCKYEKVIHKCASWKKECVNDADFMMCGQTAKTRDALCPEFLGGGDCRDAVSAEDIEGWTVGCTVHHCTEAVTTIMMTCIGGKNCANVGDADKKTVCDAYKADSLCATAVNSATKEMKDAFQAVCGTDIVGKKLEKTVADSSNSSSKTSSEESSSGLVSLAPAIMLALASM